MGDILDVTGAIGAGILLLIISVGAFGAVFVSGHWVAERQKSRWQGIAAGLAVFAITVLFLARPLDALKETSCVTATDRQACIDGDDE